MQRPRTSFVGRAPELATLRAHIRDATPLVTVTGPPGIGKSAIVSRVLEDAPLRVVWVQGPFEKRSEICGAVARAMGVQPAAKSEAELETSVAAMLDGAGEMLLVLDDFDRGATEASLLSSWLATASELSIVVTSRTRLRCVEEHVVEIGPLGTPEASELFEARASQAGDAITADDRAHLPELASRLDGIPLALELAAAQHRVLGVRDMIARGSAQTSLRATLDAAWATLSDDERALLSHCTVFRGSFTAAAAEAVMLPGKTPAIELLESLRDKSWLFVRRTQRGSRFFLGLTVRDCAARKLVRKDEDAVRLRHRDYYAALAESPATHALEDDHVEIMAAADACEAAGDGELEARILVGFVARSFSFGFDVLERVGRLAQHSERMPARLRVALLLAHARVGFLGDTARPLSHVEIHELAVASGDPRLIVESGVLCINEQLIEGRVDERVVERLRALGETPGADSATRAWWHVIAGKMAESSGDMTRAVSEATRGCELGRLAGDLRVELNARSVHVYALLETGDLDGALAAATLAAERSEPAGPAAERFALMALASVKQCRGDFAGAEASYERARSQWVGSAVAWTCACLSAVARHQRTGEDVRAEMAFAIGEVDRMGRGRIASPVRALLALLEEKHGDHDRARAAIDLALRDPFDAPGERVAIDLCRAHVMSDTPAVAKLTRALEANEVPRTVEALLALALLREPPRGSARPSIVIDAEGRFFVVGGTRVSCARRPVMQRILAELVRASREGTKRTADDLVAAAWPGERFISGAAHNRLRVMIFRMRQEGLRATLAGTDEGYSLEPPFVIA